MGQCLTSQSTKPNDQAAAAEQTREAIYAAYNGDGTTGPTFDCEICIETTTLQQSFNPKGCTHFYCNQCTAKYIDTELSEKSATQISCPEPGCEGLLDPDHCRQILPAKLLNRWEAALVDSAIDVSEKVYCPYSDCTVLSINDKSTPSSRRRGFVLRGGGCHSSKRKCLNCKRKMCVKCECAWHDKMTCETYQKLNREGEEKMMELLAKLKRWKKCPVCKYYVARRSGCSYIKCRCGNAFCYLCGSLFRNGIHTEDKDGYLQCPSGGYTSCSSLVVWPNNGSPSLLVLREWCTS